MAEWSAQILFRIVALSLYQKLFYLNVYVCKTPFQDAMN